MNTILSLGSNGRYQLGQNHDEDVEHATHAFGGVDVGGVYNHKSIRGPYNIACGGNHTVIIDLEDGSAYMVGENTRGQCGPNHGPNETVDSDGRILIKQFSLLNVPIKWKLACAGWAFTILVSTDNEVYSFGWGPKGELGLGPVKKLSLDTGYHHMGLQQLQFDGHTTIGNIIQVEAGLNHVAILLENGQVWGWGAGDKGQLGLPRIPTVFEPRRLQNFEGTPVEDYLGVAISHIGCGNDFTAFSNLTKGSILVLGTDKFGIKNVPEACRRSKNFLHLGAGWTSLHVLLANGKVISWGNNGHGQHAPEEVSGDSTISSPTQLSQISVGSEHVLGVSLDRRTVYSWGWGEHGNCGPVLAGPGNPTGSNIAVRKLNTTYQSSSRITDVFAGVATSWISEQLS